MWPQQTKFLASLRWKRGCQPFSCRFSQNVTHCRKEICWTCLSKESMPLCILFWNLSPHSLPEAWVPESGSTLHQVLLFVAAESKKPPHAEKQRVLTRLGRRTQHPRPQTRALPDRRQAGRQEKDKLGDKTGDKKDYRILIVLSLVLCDCCKPMNSCRDWAFSNSGLEVGLPAFQLPMFPKCDTLPKGDLFNIFVQRIHSHMFFWQFQASTPCQKLQVPESRSTLYQKQVPESVSTLHQVIMVASCLQKIELWYPSFGLQAIDCDHATAASQWRIVENQLLDAFSLRGLEAGLPAFQLPMVGKCDVLPKRDLFDLLIQGIHCRHSFGKCQASIPYQKLGVPESGSTLHQLCIMLVLCLQKIPSLCRRFRICVPCREA